MKRISRHRKPVIRVMVKNYYSQLKTIDTETELELKEYLENLDLTPEEVQFGLSIKEEPACLEA